MDPNKRPYGIEPCNEVYCFRLNFNIIKIGLLGIQYHILQYSMLELKLYPYSCSSFLRVKIAQELFSSDNN